MNNGILPLMGFPIANSGAGGTASFAPQEVEVVAGDIVSPGNLVVMQTDGRVYPAQASAVPVSFFNNDSLQTLTGYSATSPTSWFDASLSGSNYAFINPNSSDAAIRIAGTDVFCVLSTGDGGSGGEANRLRLHTCRGNTFVATTTITTAGSQDAPAKILDLGNGNVLIIYWGGSSNRYEIRNAVTHAVVLSAVTLTNSPINNSSAISASLLSNGDAVIAFNNNSTSCFWRVISNTGTIVVAESSFSMSSIASVSTTAGGGWFAIGFSSGGSQGSFRRYTNAGVLVGSAVVVPGASFAAAGNDSKRVNGRLFMRSDGTLLCLDTDSSTRTITVYGTDNAVITTSNIWSSSQGSIFNRVFINNNLYVFASANGVSADRAVIVFGLNNQVNLSRQIITGVSLLSLATSIDSELFEVADDGTMYAAVTMYSNSTGFYQANLLVFDAGGTQLSNTILRSSAGGILRFRNNLYCNGTLFIGSAENGQSNTGAVAGRYFPVRQSIFGVARGSATAGGRVRVQVTGTTTLTPTLVGGIAFDRRTATPPGIRGVVGSSSAVLYGPF